MKYGFLFALILNSFYGVTQPWTPMRTCVDSPFFSFQNDQHKYGVMDRDSNIVVPAVYNFVYLNRTPNDTCAITNSLAVFGTDTSQFAMNLNTLDRTKSYPFITIVNQYVYYSDSVQWGVYDSNISLIFHSMNGTPGVLEGRSISFSLIEFGEQWHDYYQGEQLEVSKMWLQELPNPVKIDENIICFSVDESPQYTTERDFQKYLNWRKRHPLAYPPGNMFGLINLSNGIIKKARYHLIMPTLYNDKFYYWCVRLEKLTDPNRMSPANGFVDVYDSYLNKVKRMDIDHSTFGWSFAMNQIIMRDRDSNLLIQVKQNDKTSCYLPNGKKIISEKDSVNYLGLGLYISWEENKAKLLNSNGVQILKGEYNQIRYYYNYYPNLIVKTNSTPNSWCVVDLDGAQSHTNCTKIWYYNGWSNYETPQESLQSLPPPTFRCIRNNKLHVVIDEKMILLDSNNYHFNLPTIGINNHLININGEVVFEYTFLRNVNDDFYWGRHKNTGIISSINGEIVQTIEDIYNIQFLESGMVEIIFQNRSKKYFNPVEWKWYE